MPSDRYLHLSAPNPRPGIIDDAWWGEHAPRTAVGISIYRHEAPVILLSPDGSTTHGERRRLRAKASGVTLAMSFVDDAIRGVDL